MSVCDTLTSHFFGSLQDLAATTFGICTASFSKIFGSLQDLAAATFGFSKASFCSIFEEAPVGFKNGTIEGFFVGPDPFPGLLLEVVDRDLDLRGDCKTGVLVDTLETVFVSSK